MPIATLDKPTETINASALLIDVESLLGLEQLRYGPARALVILELQIADQVMRVKVELFNTERCRYFAFFIDIAG